MFDFCVSQPGKTVGNARLQLVLLIQVTCPGDWVDSRWPTLSQCGQVPLSVAQFASHPIEASGERFVGRKRGRQLGRDAAQAQSGRSALQRASGALRIRCSCSVSMAASWALLVLIPRTNARRAVGVSGSLGAISLRSRSSGAMT